MAEIAQKYRDEVERLAEASYREIISSWSTPDPLFLFCSPNGMATYQGQQCGCITQVHSYPTTHFAFTQEITDAIVADTRIPPNGIEGVATTPANSPARREILEVCAEWQTRLDREIRST